MGYIRIENGQFRLFAVSGDGVELVGLFRTLGDAKKWGVKVWAS